MLQTRYIAITYDVCEHNDLYEDMNEYVLDDLTEMDKQVKELAKKDVAPLIKVYEVPTDKHTDATLFKEYKFKEYECNCKQ